VGPKPVPTNNIRLLTNLAIKSTIGTYDVDYETRLIEDANVTKYVVMMGNRTSFHFLQAQTISIIKS
jgi:hypothetical protein